MVSLLDIIGPVMVGPSSSHTAGACRIGLFARALFGDQPEHAKVELHGSFARTGSGHGTDRAIAGGLLGFGPDDERLRESVEIAARSGLSLVFQPCTLRGDPHPNTARLTLSRGRETAVVVGASLGGGRIRIAEIDGYPVEISAEYPTIVIVAHDEPGIVAAVSRALAGEGANIATVRVRRRRKGGDAIQVYELDAPPSAAAIAGLGGLKAVRLVRSLNRIV